MRDPFSWSFGLVRLFGVTVRVHLWFVILAVGYVLRVAIAPPPEGAPAYLPNLWIDACILVGLLFVAVLLHELGHCLAARMVDGDAQEVMLWPLGGLTAPELPQSPYAHFVTAAAGPAMNLVLCAACGLLLVSHSLLPPWNPWSDQLAPVMRNWADGGFQLDPRYQQNPERLKLVLERHGDKPAETAKPAPPPADTGTSMRALEPEKVAWLDGFDILLGRFFWVNWLLCLINLLPGFPLDGGRMLQALYWSRGEYRQAMRSAVYAGFVVMIGILILGVVSNEFFLLILAWIIYTACKTQLYVLETGSEEPGLGYEFAQGFASLDPDQPAPPPRPRRPNFIQRWLQRRAERKQQRDQECREAEERRLDELLEKVAQSGIQALTDEERRFLTRVSSRYKNKQSG